MKRKSENIIKQKRICREICTQKHTHTHISAGCRLVLFVTTVTHIKFNWNGERLLCTTDAARRYFDGVNCLYTRPAGTLNGAHKRKRDDTYMRRTQSTRHMPYAAPWCMKRMRMPGSGVVYIYRYGTLPHIKRWSTCAAIFCILYDAVRARRTHGQNHNMHEQSIYAMMYDRVCDVCMRTSNAGVISCVFHCIALHLCSLLCRRWMTNGGFGDRCQWLEEQNDMRMDEGRRERGKWIFDMQLVWNVTRVSLIRCCQCICDIYLLTHNWLYWHSAETHNTHDKSRIFNPHQQYYCDASKIEFFAGCMFTPIRIACSITSIRFFFFIRLNYTFTAVVPLDYNVLIDLTVEKNKISHRILILHVYRWRSN